MKLLMFGMSSYPGGIENYIRNIFFHRECSEKIQIDFITYESDLAYSQEMPAYGYRIFHVPHLKKHPLGYFRAVSKIIKEQQYDAVYVNMLCAANPLPVFFAKKNKVPRLILHAHSNSTIKGAARGFLHRLCKGYCDRAATLRLACSQEAAAWLFCAGNHRTPVEIIPNAIDTGKYTFLGKYRAEIRQQYGVKEDECLLGSVGRLAPEKNHFFMLDVLRTLRDQHVPAKLLLVGDGVLRDAIEAKIVELHLENAVFLAGTVMDPYPYYSALDRFLFPSSFEGFGIAALEAQACGLPCYCADTLSRELDVTHTVRYLPLAFGAAYWADAIRQDKTACDPALMHAQIEESLYSIANQRNRVWEFIYGE